MLTKFLWEDLAEAMEVEDLGRDRVLRGHKCSMALECHRVLAEEDFHRRKEEE